MDEFTEGRMNSFSRELARRVRRYLDIKEHREEFEEWYLKKYGKPYQWKKLSEMPEYIREDQKNEHTENRKRFSKCI